MKRRLAPRLAQTLLWIWLLPALACNLPQAPTVAPTSDLLFNTPGTTPFASPMGRSPEPNPNPPEPTTSPRPTEVYAFPGLNPLREFEAGISLSVLVNPGGGRYVYLTLPGDTLNAIMGRFAVETGAIHTPDGRWTADFLSPGTRLEIEMPEAWTLPSAALLPDSEIVFGPGVADFSTADFIGQAGGYLAGYSEMVDQELLSGAEIVERVARDTSTNPRLLLAFLEFRAGWVLGRPDEPVETIYPVGFGAGEYRGLYKELILTARQLSLGLYGWRSGMLASVTFPNGAAARIHPGVNAGTAALTVLFSKLYRREGLGTALYGPDGFLALYFSMFGDPWARAAGHEPLFTADFLSTLPVLELPFGPGQNWNLTGGPHPDWGSASPLGGLDFAPSGEGAGCFVSTRWAAAVGPGVVVRSERGMLLLDLDGDGFEQTGWVMLYLHLAEVDRAPAGTWVETGALLGHPSCEGGKATGAHVHIARKYNGEWVGAGAETPFVLSGWRVEPGSRPYLGRLVNADGTVVSAQPDGSSTSLISR